jgi:hypothetical protein
MKTQIDIYNIEVGDVFLLFKKKINKKIIKRSVTKYKREIDTNV